MCVDLQGFDCGTIGFGHGLSLAWTWLRARRHLTIRDLVSDLLALPSRHVKCVVCNLTGEWFKSIAVRIKGRGDGELLKKDNEW